MNQTSTSKKEKRRQRHEADRQAVADIRTRNETAQREKAAAKEARRRKRAALSGADRKAFLAEEKAERERARQDAKQQRTKARTEYRAMSSAERKTYRKERDRQKSLERRAKKGYVVRQIAICLLIAALAGALTYGGIVAYGAFVDNSFAFQHTQEAVKTPAPTQAPVETPPPDEPTAPPAEATAQPAEAPQPSPTQNPYDLLLSQADLSFMEARVNILMLGIDESLERADWKTFRTDTMILISIDFETSDIFMISLPRDSFVWVYGQEERGKINTAFAKGGGKDKNGFEYAMNTVSMTLGGVPVNHYICFDMNVVKEVVDALGGLYYDVDVDVDMCGRTIKPGYQYMDGQMVLDYCRQRKGSSDIARAERQQQMIFAIFDEVKNSGQMQDVPDIYAAVTGNIYTDLAFNQIVSLAAFGMQADLSNLNKYMLPGGFLNIDGVSLWGIKQDDKRRMVKDIFGVSIQVSMDDDLETLLPLAAEKRRLVWVSGKITADAESYVVQNIAHITAAEKNDFDARTLALRNTAAIEEPHEIALTVPLLQEAVDAYNAWFASFKAEIEARKTPAPSPTA